MRPLALILLVLASCGVLRAQEDPKMESILHPDLNQGSFLQNKTFYSGGASGLDSTKSANVKTFDFVQKFFAKSFETKAFESKDYWQGEFQFTTKAAAVKTSPDADKIFATKSAPVKDATESSKVYDTKGYATREADEKGKTSQAHLDEVFKGGKSQMNMDQVRDLLNKDHRIAPTEISAPQ